jgi:hypothetical protein
LWRRFCSGEAEQIEWSKIQTPTDEVAVPYGTLAPPPEGAFARSNLILDVSSCWLWIRSGMLVVTATWISEQFNQLIEVL